MRLIPQCFGPEELGIALRLARTMPYQGAFATLDICPALSAYRLLVPSMATLGAGTRPPYVAGFTRYVVGEGRAAHLDPSSPAMPSAEHMRIVVCLHRALEGGELDIAGDVAELWPGDAVLFRADAELHQVRNVRTGLRLAFTCGVLL